MKDVNTIEPKPAELVLTLEITRASTGETETVTLVGSVEPEQLKETE